METNELRCLEESLMMNLEGKLGHYYDDDDDDDLARGNRPRYADHVLALRILVECTIDVKRTLNETLAEELRKLAHLAQRHAGRLEQQLDLTWRDMTQDEGIGIVASINRTI